MKSCNSNNIVMTMVIEAPASIPAPASMAVAARTVELSRSSRGEKEQDDESTELWKQI